MTRLAAVLDVVLAAFTALVIAGEGMPKEAVWAAFTVLAVAIPLASAAVLWWTRTRGGRRAGAIEQATVIANALLLAGAGWAVVRTYPHPPEDGVVAYAVILLAAPIATVAALLGGARSGSTSAPAGRSGT